MALSRRAGSARQWQRGFSLVELMAVVMIVGILAVVGIMLVRQHIISARVNDGRVGVMTIRAAEESFRSANGRYLECSARTNPKYYPNQALDDKVYTWSQDTHTDYAQWKMLSVERTSPTRFGFAVNAGLPGEALPKSEAMPSLTLPVVPDNWYLIWVKGNVDGDTDDYTIGTAVSWKTDIYFSSEE